jgi:sulfur carrier protein ThiS
MNTGLVDIHGREYKTVALRVNEFRAEYGDFAIETDIVEATDKIVVMRAVIKDTTGRVIATGHAEENRSASAINKTSAMENCETSAVGRALAFFGLAGSEIASADEVAAAVNGRAIDRSVDIGAEIAALNSAVSLYALHAAWKPIYEKHKGNPATLRELVAAKDKKKGSFYDSTK